MRSESDMTENRRRTLAAAVARILPSSDGPGAAEADVLGYIEETARQASFRPARQRFTSGIDLLQALAMESHGKDFADCAPSEQDGVLKDLQSIPHPIARRFFSMLVNMTVAGFLCDPIHGGNRDGAGWRFIGLPGPLESAPDVRK